MARIARSCKKMELGMGPYCSASGGAVLHVTPPIRRLPLSREEEEIHRGELVPMPRWAVGAGQLMPQVLMVIGAILALLGVASIAAGAPDWVLGLSLGATLIHSGMIALVGGLVLIGLALVLNAVQELLNRLDAVSAAQMARRPAIEQKKRPVTAEPAIPGARGPSEDMPLPGSDLSDFLEGPAVRARRDASSGYRIEESGGGRRERGTATESAKPRGDGLPTFASDEQMRVRRESAPSGDATPARLRRDGAGGDGEFAGEDRAFSRPTSPSTRREEAARPRRGILPLPPPPLPLPPDARPRPRDVLDGAAPRFRPIDAKPADPANPETTVVRSGVIGGMAYTLYADGSIEAELPIGTVRFGSIADLQDHVTRTGAEADVDFKESSR
jgi:hypothetical protein